MKIKLGIIFGGVSVEHEISVITANQAISNVNTEKYEIIPLYISKKGYVPAEMIHPENCIGCAVCYRMCPDIAITVIKE